MQKATVETRNRKGQELIIVAQKYRPELVEERKEPKGLYYKRTEEQYITKATIIFLFTLSELKRKRVPQKSLKQC